MNAYQQHNTSTSVRKKCVRLTVIENIVRMDLQIDQRLRSNESGFVCLDFNGMKVNLEVI